MGDIFCAHFRLASPVFVQFEPGQTVTKQALNDRFKEHPMENSRMIKGNVEPPSSVKFDAKCRVPSGMEGGEYDNEVFTCQCWSYEYAATRGDRKTQHCFCVYQFRSAGVCIPDTLVCINRLDSSSFTVLPVSQLAKKRVKQEKKISKVKKITKVNESETREENIQSECKPRMS